MITAETIECTSTVDPPNYVEFIRNWATTVECTIPADGFPWATLWQAVAAVATIVTVLLAYWQTKNARADAKIAQDGMRDAQERLDNQLKDERYLRASRLSAWVSLTPEAIPIIHIKNGAEDTFYELTIHHEGLFLEKTTYPIVAPGFETGIQLTKQFPDGPQTGQRIPAGLVHITFTDALGYKYERNPEHKGILTELGPCYE